VPGKGVLLHTYHRSFPPSSRRPHHLPDTDAHLNSGTRTVSGFIPVLTVVTVIGVTALHQPFNVPILRGCYGCKDPGHILRNCPEKEKYLNRLRRFHQVGTGAHLVLQQSENEPSDEVDEIVNFIDDLEDDGFDEFDAWICELMDIVDNNDSPFPTTTQEPSHGTYHSSQDAYVIKSSLSELEHAMRELMVHNVNNIVQRLLVDPGAPKCLCNEPWLQNANWMPFKKIPLPPHILPFRFAGHGILAMTGVQCSCIVRRMSRCPPHRHPRELPYLPLNGFRPATHTNPVSSRTPDSTQAVL